MQWSRFCLSWQYLSFAARRVQWARELGFKTFHGLELT